MGILWGVRHPLETGAAIAAYIAMGTVFSIGLAGYRYGAVERLMDQDRSEAARVMRRYGWLENGLLWPKYVAAFFVLMAKQLVRER